MEFGIEAETSRTEQRIPEQYSLTVTEETDRYIVKGIFEKGQMVMLSLKDSHGQNHNYFISTAA